jgi:hypothetical protein
LPDSGIAIEIQNHLPQFSPFLPTLVPAMLNLIPSPDKFGKGFSFTICTIPAKTLAAPAVPLDHRTVFLHKASLVNVAYRFIHSSLYYTAGGKPQHARPEAETW